MNQPLVMRDGDGDEIVRNPKWKRCVPEPQPCPIPIGAGLGHNCCGECVQNGEKPWIKKSELKQEETHESDTHSEAHREIR